MDRATKQRPLASLRRSAAGRHAVGSGQATAGSALQRRWADVIHTSVRQVAQRRRLQALFGPGGPGVGRAVVQLGGKYDGVMVRATDDVDTRADYGYASVSDDDYVAAVDELIAEHLQAGFVGPDGQDVVPPKATMDAKGWGGAPEILYIPRRTNGLNMMMGSNTFLPALIHEVSHFAVESQANAGLKAAVAKLAAQAGVEAEDVIHAAAHPNKEAWIEESRADLTSVYLRYVRDGKKPGIGDYEALLGEEPADGEHPPGSVRVKLIQDYLDTLP